MVVVGLHVAHEQFAPSRLLGLAQAAERAGFRSLLSSDPLLPSSRAQGHGGFAWSWLGAALASTSLSCGVLTAPGQRYHPAVVAQACATLAEMFPGRFWVAVGPGENLHEHVTGDRWPPPDMRDHRLQEAADVMRELWAGREVTREGLVRVERARLFTLPPAAIALHAAAFSASAAESVGEWADGLLAVASPDLPAVIRAFRHGGGVGKPVVVTATLAWAEDEETARVEAWEQWRTNVVAGPLFAELATPEELEMAALHVRPEDVARAIPVSADPHAHLRRLEEVARAGADAIYLHNVTTAQEAFVETFGREVLPALTSARSPWPSPSP